MGDFFTAYARVSGAFLAIVAAGFAISAIVRLLNQEPFGEALLVAVFAGIMAALLLSVRDENSQDSQGPRQD